MEIIQPASGLPEHSQSLAQAREDTWGPQASRIKDVDKQSIPSAGDVGPPYIMPPGLEPGKKWSPLPADASPEEIQKNLEREAGELAAQITKDHFADPTQEKVAQFVDRFPEGIETGLDMINAKLAKDGLYLNYENDPDLLAKKYTAKMLKEGTFQNDIVGAVSLIDKNTNTSFPDVLMLLGPPKRHYDI